MAFWRLGAPLLIFGSACTEPNPFAGDDTSTSAGTAPTTGADATAPSTGGDTPTSAESSPTTGSDGPTTGADACAIGTHVCVRAAPEGWQGPIARVDDAPDRAEPGCSGVYGEPVDVVYSGLVAPEETCDCECQGPNGADCSAASLLRDDSADCASPNEEWPIGLACSSGPDGPAGAYWRAEAAVDEGSCTENATVDIPPAYWSERHTLCGTDSVDPGGCSEGEVCASIPTAPFSTQLCIYAVGEEECPTDLGYDERSVWHRDFTDDRDCTECTCLINGECTGALHLFDTQTCQGPLVDGTVALGGSCVQVDVAIEGALVAEFEPDATCIANGGALQGDADPLSPVTLCCRR